MATLRRSTPGCPRPRSHGRRGAGPVFTVRTGPARRRDRAQWTTSTCAPRANRCSCRNCARACPPAVGAFGLPTVVYAGFWIRLGAAILDGLILIPIYLLFALALYFFSDLHNLNFSDPQAISQMRLLRVYLPFNLAAAGVAGFLQRLFREPLRRHAPASVSASCGSSTETAAGNFRSAGRWAVTGPRSSRASCRTSASFTASWMPSSSWATAANVLCTT